MKCFNCGNLIPDSSVLCPYCNTKLTNDDTGITNPIKEGDTSIIPITPTEAVLPQDKLEGTPVVSGNSQGFIHPNTGDSNSNPTQVVVNRTNVVTIDLTKPIDLSGKTAVTAESIDSKLMETYGDKLVEEPLTHKVDELSGKPPIVYGLHAVGINNNPAPATPVEQPQPNIQPEVLNSPIAPTATPVQPEVVAQPVAPATPAAAPVEEETEVLEELPSVEPAPVTVPVVPVAPATPEVVAAAVAPVAIPVEQPQPVIQPEVLNSPIAPAAPATPIEQAQPVMPVTPEAVVAPVQPVAPAVPVAEPDSLALNPAPVTVPVQPEVVAQPVAPVTPEAVAAPVAQVTPAAPVAEPDPLALNPTAAPVAPATPAENQPTDQTTSDDGFIYGVPVGRTAPIIKKKEHKGSLLKIVIIVLVVAILGGGGYFVYSTLFGSADKRINAATDKLFEILTSIRTSALEKKSGSYTFKLDISANEKSYGFDMNGNYDYDLKRQIFFIDTNVQSLKYENELLDDDVDDLKVVFYKFERKNYIHFKNFFDQYIYTTSPDDGAFAGVPQNDINYSNIVGGITSALKASVLSASHSQSVGDDSLDGKTRKMNIVTLNLSKADKERVLNSFKTRLTSNQNLLTQISNVRNIKSDNLVTEINTFFDGIQVTDNKESIKIYTDLFSGEFFGIKYVGTFDDVKYEIELVPNNGAYKINIKKAGKEYIKGTYSRVIKRESAAVITTYDVDLVVNVDGIAYNVAIDLETNDSLTPIAEKLNTKNSVAQEYLTEKEVESINEAINNYGTFGLKRVQVLEDLTSKLDSLPFDNIGTKIFNIFNKYISVGDLVVKDNPDDLTIEPFDNGNTEEETPTGQAENQTN